MTLQSQAINFRLPCLYQGTLQYAPLSDFQGQATILCCLSVLTERDAWVLRGYAAELTKSNWILALLLSQPLSFVESWSRPLHDFAIPIFTDPLKRFCRSLNLFQKAPLRRCESLIFDHQSCLQYRLTHDLNLRDLSTVLEVVKNDLGPQPEVSPFRTSTAFNPTKNFHSGSHNLGQPREKETSPDGFSQDISLICV